DRFVAFDIRRVMSSRDPRPLLEPVLVSLVAHPVEVAHGRAEQPLGPWNSISLTNLGSQPRDVTFSIAITSVGATERLLKAKVDDETLQEVQLRDSGSTSITLRYTAQPGTTTIDLEID